MKTGLIVLIAFLLSGCGKNFQVYEPLLDPQISQKAPQKMLVYQAVGDPNETVGKAFGALFSTFFKLKRNHNMEMVAPIARWPKSADTPRDQWVGIYGIPVSESVMEIPTTALEEYPDLKLETWSYGEVAEILHIGSYATENPTVERLHEFIMGSGYEISGLHEEEYLKGPGMVFKGNPNKYYTIIRYPVIKPLPSDKTTSKPQIPPAVRE